MTERSRAKIKRTLQQSKTATDGIIMDMRMIVQLYAGDEYADYRERATSIIEYTHLVRSEIIDLLNEV